LKRVSAHIFCLGSEGVRPFGVILGNEVGQRWGDMKLLIQNAASVLDSDDPKDPWASEAERSVMIQVWMTRIYRQRLWAVDVCGSGEALFKLVHSGC